MTSREGGVILVILNTLSFKLLPLPCNIEAVAVKIVCQKPIIICDLYIYPSVNKYHTEFLHFFFQI